MGIPCISLHFTLWSFRSPSKASRTEEAVREDGGVLNRISVARRALRTAFTIISRWSYGRTIIVGVRCVESM
jgi:hypothetical protein